MRTVVILAIGLMGLAVLAYTSRTATDCARELSWCVSDPPLFVKLTGTNVKVHCQAGFQACEARRHPPADEADMIATATREPANAGHSNVLPASGEERY